MSVESYMLPCIVWSRGPNGPYLNVDASMRTIDLLWFDLHYPDKTYIAAFEYVQKRLKHISENPKEVGRIGSYFRDLEARANSEFSRKVPTDRAAWLRRFSLAKYVQENNDRKKKGLAMKPYMPRKGKKDSAEKGHHDEEPGALPEDIYGDDMPEQNYEPLEKVVLR